MRGALAVPVFGVITVLVIDLALMTTSRPRGVGSAAILGVDVVALYNLSAPVVADGLYRLAQAVPPSEPAEKPLKGMKVSAGGVRGVWSRHNLLTKHERLLRLEKATSERKIELIEEQIRLLERFLHALLREPRRGRGARRQDRQLRRNRFTL